MAEEQKTIAAVVSPLMFMPCFNIAPAPMKPIPVTTPAAIRVQSLVSWNFAISIDNMLNKHEEMEISIKVLIPIISWCCFRSIPRNRLHKRLATNLTA